MLSVAGLMFLLQLAGVMLFVSGVMIYVAGGQHHLDGPIPIPVQSLQVREREYQRLGSLVESPTSLPYWQAPGSSQNCKGIRLLLRGQTSF